MRRSPLVRPRRAVIPCGGTGARMRALTGGAPKELLPIAGEPLVSHVARECAASGVEQLLVVVAPGKEAIVEHLSARAGAAGLPATIEFIVQTKPRGLGDAIRLARDFAAGEPIAVALPDNLFVGDVPGVAQVIDAHAASGCSVVAVVEISAGQARRRGPTAIYHGQLDGDLYRIARIPPKGERGARFDTGGAPSAYTGVGRYVLEADAFDAIDAVEQALPLGTELDDVPVLQHLLHGGRLVGRRIGGQFFDVGLPDGYRDAQLVLTPGKAP